MIAQPYSIFEFVLKHRHNCNNNAFALSVAQVAWIKADAKAILAIHEHVITNNDRLSVTHNDYNTWTLNIRGVKMEDAGKYMCQVNTDPMKMQVSMSQICNKLSIAAIDQLDSYKYNLCVHKNCDATMK